MERKAKETCANFTEVCKRAKPNLKELAIRGTDILCNLNRDYIRMCKASDEGFSESEIEFYKGEIAKLNEAIDQKRSDRT